MSRKEKYESGVYLTLPLVTILAVLFSPSCTTEKFEPVNIDYGYEYFPLNTGAYWIYEVDSIIYDPALGGTDVDTIRSFLKEEITGTLTDNTGQLVYRVEQTTRRSHDDPWQIQKAIVLSSDESRAFRIEDNLRFVKLVFPLKTNQRWDGHVFFDPSTKFSVAGESLELFKDWNYQVVAVGIETHLGNQSFDEVAVISMADSENLIERRLAVEHYAKGVGLVYRELTILDTQCTVCCHLNYAQCQSLPWNEKAEKGFQLQQRLIEYR